jgi:hypothetical protein
LNADTVLISLDITTIGGIVVTYVMAYLQQSALEKTDLILTSWGLVVSKVIRYLIVLIQLAFIGFEIQFNYFRLNYEEIELIGKVNARLVIYIIIKSLAVIYFVSCSYVVQRTMNSTMLARRDGKIRASVVRIRLLFYSAFSMIIWIIANALQYNGFTGIGLNQSYIYLALPSLFINIADCVTHIFQQIYLAPGPDLVKLAEKTSCCKKCKRVKGLRDPEGRLESGTGSFAMSNFSSMSSLRSELMPREARHKTTI